ncbi:MAG TPA: hypothetical protein VKS79_12495 [Gemmataceae bacterium]|nr:hypothetical protein [Gemmataceae bacterium]
MANIATSASPPANASGAMAAQNVIEFQTRFLFPFFFDRGRNAEAAETLIADRPGAGDQPLWSRSQPHPLYTDEFLDHVVRYLFPGLDRSNAPGPVECEYLRADDKTLEKWFQHAEVQLPSGRTLRAGKRPSAEMFVTSQGVGLLVMTIGVEQSGLTGEDVAEFNYRLSQFRRRPITGFVKPHPADNPEKYSALPAEAKEKIKPKPADDAPIHDQLASPYGRFTLKDLVNRLARVPLQRLHFHPVEPRELSVYTVVRLPETDMADAEVRAKLGPLLSALAQIEERGNAGTDPSDLSVPAMVVNRRHWAAVGVLGASHLVADQTNGQGNPADFNEQRVRIVRDKYFVSFLVTMLQRLTLNRAVEEAAGIFASQPERRGERTARLRQDLLRFGVGGQFNQISSRHAHHRYYQLCRDGLDVLPAWEDIRGVLAELDADRVAQEQTNQQTHMADLAGEVAHSVTEIERLQSVVHTIEYLLGIVYGAHFFHMLLSENHSVRDLLGIGEKAHHHYVTGITLVGALVGFFFVFIVDRLRMHRKE